jgi:multisubunit Na+/H+ antiporter MnhG subunit
MNKEFDKLCTPAKLYFLIAVISILYALFNHFNIVFSIIKLIFALVWTLVLSCLCDKGFTYLSWFLVLFPYFLMLIAFLGIYRIREGMTDTTAQKQNKPVVRDAYKQGFTVGGESTGITYPNK